MTKTPMRGRVAKWFEIGGVPVARYLVSYVDGAATWSARIEESAVLTWADARQAATLIHAVPLIAEDGEELVVSGPSASRAVTDLERRGLW